MLVYYDFFMGMLNWCCLLDSFFDLIWDFKFGSLCVVLMLDFDGFKLINDVYGYVFGDSLLCSFVNWLEEIFGKEGMVVCLGGDEFVIILLVFDDKVEVFGFVCRLLICISDWFEFGERVVIIGLGIGIVFYLDDGYVIMEFLCCVDIVFYWVKFLGWFVYWFFEVDMDVFIFY